MRTLVILIGEVGSGGCFTVFFPAFNVTALVGNSRFMNLLKITKFAST